MASTSPALLVLLAAPLGSCATTHRIADPEVPTGHHFSYLVTNRESVDLIQAFDDGAKTYLQFGEAPPKTVELRHVPDDRRLEGHVDDHYLIVMGVYDTLRLTVGGRSATVINQDLPAHVGEGEAASYPVFDGTDDDSKRPKTMSAVNGALPRDCLSSSSSANSRIPDHRPVSIGVPDAIQTMNSNLRVSALKQEISALEEKVHRLSSQIEEAERAGSAPSLYMRDRGTPPRVVVKFDDNSFEPRVQETLLEPLGEAARAANRIYLHGHTDAYVASEAGRELAIRRTVEVRRLLIALSVEPQRIRLFYRGAGNFVANNSTPEGKALNRRVEIEMRKW